MVSAMGVFIYNNTQSLSAMGKFIEMQEQLGGIYIDMISYMRGIGYNNR